MAITSLFRRLLPAPLRRWLVRQSRWPRVGGVRPEDLRRTRPIGRAWGGDRGTPIDRIFIERFLAARAPDVRGTVLEFGDDSYARRFGGDRISRMEIADVSADNPRATRVVDLGAGTGMPEGELDCIICTQTLQFIGDDVRAVAALRRGLRPGGVLLVTVPGVSQVVLDERNPWQDYRRYTPAGLRRLLAAAFPDAAVDVEAHGNVFSAIAFLHGLAAEELMAEELDTSDPAYPVIVTARVVAPG
jgi:SAM-dependent methyltransferase